MSLMLFPFFDGIILICVYFTRCAQTEQFGYGLQFRERWNELSPQEHCTDTRHYHRRRLLLCPQIRKKQSNRYCETSRSPLAEGELTARDVPADAFAMHIHQIASMLKFNALDALRNKSATSPISSNLFAHHPNISFLLAWGIDKELD